MKKTTCGHDSRSRWGAEAVITSKPHAVRYQLPCSQGSEDSQPWVCRGAGIVGTHGGTSTSSGYATQPCSNNFFTLFTNFFQLFILPYLRMWVQTEPASISLSKIRCILYFAPSNPLLLPQSNCKKSRASTQTTKPLRSYFELSFFSLSLVSIYKYLKTPSETLLHLHGPLLSTWPHILFNKHFITKQLPSAGPWKWNRCKRQIDCDNSGINEVWKKLELLQGGSKLGHFEIEFYPICCSVISRAKIYL